MALSMLNYFIWEKEDARVPFLIADCIVLAVLRFIEQRNKVHKAAIKDVSNVHHESDKKTHMALKKAQRDERLRFEQQSQKNPKGSTTHMNPQINQPDKKK